MHSDFWPPCQAACPILTDVQKYVSLAALDKFGESFEVARATNPFVTTCGYICMHPCEDECRRASVDEAVSIMALKRAVAEHRAEHLREAGGSKPDAKPGVEGRRGRPEDQPPKEAKVAVVGAGPAGLTAALDLVGLGYKVEVFEREKKAGGMLSLVIPTYRLPRQALAADIKAIEAAGVKIELGREIGRDLSLEDIKRQGFEAVIVASGLPLSQELPGFPADGSTVQLAMPFLKAIAEGEKTSLGDQVVVIGGGNVAIDAARSALRLGAKNVSILYRRGRKEMPATETEIEEAGKEGVSFRYLSMVKRLLRESGKASGVECIRAKLGEPDESGRRRPVPIKGSEFIVDADTVIVAVGQTHDPTLLGSNGKAIFGGKTAGIFLAGDVKEGPSSLVEAIRSGHAAAAEVHGYLTKTEVSVEQVEALSELTERIKERIGRRSRVERYARPVKERLQDFKVCEIGLEGKAAAKEALRCLSCAAGAMVNKDLCVACLTCVRVCPYKIPLIGEDQVAEIDPAECQACGICVTECPALAIDFRRNQEKELLADIEKALASSKKIEFYCQRRLFLEEEKSLGPDWARVRVPCVAYLSTIDILKTYEWGAEKVVVSGCPEGECFFADGQKWVQERIAKTKGILCHVGMDGESIAWRGKTT